MTYIGTLDVPSLVYLPHTHHFPRHLEFFFAVTLYNQYYIFSHHEVEVLVPKGTVAHTYHPIRRVARTSPPYTKRPYSLHVWQYLAVRSRAEGAFRVYYLLIVFLNI